jgi:hypothetical protein
MVAPVTNTGINPLLRPQQTPAVNQTANRQIAQTVLNSTPAVGKTKPSGTAISLASANSQPPANLPRGSIVDKLV